MSRTIKLVGAAALALGLAGVGMAAQEGPGPAGDGRGKRGMHGRHHGFGRGMEALNLTEAQREQLKGKPVMEQQRQLRKQIREALESGNADATKIGQLEIRAFQLRQQMKAAHEKAQADFVNVLTAEQKAQWEKMREQRKERFEQFREKREERREEK
jgi:Spy/CpxP family protein refolding chaperone